MRIVLGVEYDGSGFCGFQTQANLLTIQETLEKAISLVADTPISIFCAGRTDRGVHATYQIIHFDSPNQRPLRAWREGVNTHLPSSIAIKWVREVDDDFHARFSALSRRYRYIIYNDAARPAILHSKVAWYYQPLHVEAMHHAAQFLLGENDFSSFRSSECESKTPMRNMKNIQVSRSEDFVIVDIEANAFLHHMVRNIVGVLCEVGRGAREPKWVADVLQAKNRSFAAKTADPDGLYLIEVKYPEKYPFPAPQNSILFL